ncbi:MAG: YggT family protein [Hydrotalea sp.]|nr:YggT family protein [Hydrotalea sp.]
MIENIAAIFLIIFNAVVQFYYWLAIVHILLSWLLAFNIIDVQNRIAAKIVFGVNRLMMPIYDWIHQFLRPIGGGMIAMFDFRPMLFIVFLYFFRPMVYAIVAKIVTMLTQH